MTKKTRKAPVKEPTERGIWLEGRHEAGQSTSVNLGQVIILDEDKSQSARVGEKCPICKFRIRGMNHTGGTHHKSGGRKIGK